MHKRQMSFLNENNIFYMKQCGFRKKFCTTHAIMRNIEKAIDNNNSFGVFIDLQKAFDTVDHNILFEKLLQSGIRGAAN